VFHDFHKECFLFLGLGTLWYDLDADRNIVDEALYVFDLCNSVVHKEAGVAVDPLGNGAL
jgi:hypothetical protein